MTFTKITTAGAGTMGSQVSWQMAFHGKHVTVHDAIPAGLENGRAFHQEVRRHFIRQRGATRKQIDEEQFIQKGHSRSGRTPCGGSLTY